jgi:hypothetical protein
MVTGSLYKEPCIEEPGLNTSTVALRVVGGDEREASAWGYNWANLFLGDINTGTWPFRLRSLEFETVNVVMSPTGVGPQNDCADEDQQQLSTTDPPSRQRGCYIRTMKPSVQLEKTARRGSQGACRQDELIGGKLSVVKEL